MKRLHIEGNRVFLDGEEIPFIKEYKLVSSTREKDVAELTITMNIKVDRVGT